MSEQWDGRPPNPEQSGMHLLRSRLTGHLTGWYWNATTERFHHEHVTLGRASSIERYVYECPIRTAAEIEARVAKARRNALEEAANAAETEPELPGRAPLVMWVVPTALTARSIFRATKRKITAAIRSLKEKTLYEADQ
jgi:hypothetical protein